MSQVFKASRGRSTATNPPNRFEQQKVELNEEELWGRESIGTQTIDDHAVSIVSRNQSPDIPFDVSLNPYRGCEHGCAYCYARPTHEFLGYSAGLDFESKILVKRQAPRLLEAELSKPSWKVKPLALSGVTDPYQPIEKELKITRQCLEALARCRHPVMIITKNAGILRDLDLLQELARWDCVQVSLSVTTLDSELARKMEPRTSSPRQRIDAIKKLNEAGVPAGVMAGPMILGLNDTEMPAIIQAAHEAGARSATYVPLRLPGTVADVFLDWLERELPDKRERILQRLKCFRGGKLNTNTFHKRFSGQGPWAEELKHLFQLGCIKAGFQEKKVSLSTKHFLRPGINQLELEI
jgi:DNA repair photolyase